jgi:MinD-like ATPase involved in chromosome partitioning or flagellar assembly
MNHKTEKTYLNLLPLDADKVDMFAIFNGIHPQINKWIDMFVGQASFETDIHAEFNYPDLFQHFYFESKNVQKTQGQYPFGFGFPMVFDRSNALNTEGGLIAAPLFIWYLNLRPNPNRRDSWLISFDENSTIAVNEYFVAHCRQKYDLDLTEELSAYVHNRPFTANGFEEFCKNLAKKLRFRSENINSGARECPKGETLQRTADYGDIVWAGALGLFPHQDGSLIEKPAQSVDLQNFTWTAEHAHEFAVLPEDAYQREALRTVLRNKITVVEGAHGTGKTHLAANILLNALSNGQKTAVVARDLGSLMQIQNEFVKLGLGNLTFLLKDVYHDKKLLLDVLRNEQFGKAIEFKEEEFKIALKQARRLLAKSDESHQALSQSIFGDENFAEVVGHYLQSQNKAGRELLTNHLQSNDYEFSKEEYEQLRLTIQECEALYKNVNTLRHPLSHLHPSLFEGENSNSGRAFSSQQINLSAENWKALQHRYIAVYDAYAQKLMNHYETHFEDLRAQLRILKEEYSDYQFQFGADFESNSFLKMSSLRAASLFSDRSKNVLSAKEELLNQYNTLEKIFNTRKHFSHSFLTAAEKKDFKKLKLNLETFELALRGWRKSLSAMVQEELQRLNAKTSQYFDKSLSSEIKTLEEELENLLKKTNTAALYAEPLSHKMLTLPKRMHFIEETVEKLEETQLNMRDFDGFYNWQRYWLALPEKAKKLVQALIKVKPQDWLAAFDSWFFHNTLVAHYQTSALNNDALMQQMNEAEDRLRHLIPAQIAHVWNDRKKDAIKAFKSKSLDEHKLFFNAKNQVLAKNRFLKHILKNSISTFSEIYPVLLVTPQVATQLIEAEGKEFDMVIFDNAQDIDKEQVLPILQNTEGVVVMTEFSKSDGSQVTSLASKLKTSGAAVVKLNHLHRPLSETARRLNQSVFYPDLEVPFRQETVVQSVLVVHIAGKYSEKTELNEAEIAKIVFLLQEINATPFNTFPRVGVVCMNKKQRNALSNSLLNIAQKALVGWEKIEQLQRNGLGVYSIDEIAGLQFDVLLVSGTYTDTEHIHFSQRELRELINSFTQNLYWVNSIPKEKLKEAAQDRAHETAFLIANLTLLAERTKEKGGPQYEFVFSALNSFYNKKQKTQPSIFVEQVVEGLSHFIEKRYLQTDFILENQTFPLVIVPKHDEQLPIVIRIDGKLSKGGVFNPSWERRTLRELEKMGIPVQSIWSYNWWKNPTDEAFHLAQAVFAYDKKYEKPVSVDNGQSTVDNPQATEII